MPTDHKARKPVLGTRHQSSHSIVEVEYRVVWNGASEVWNVFRNGAQTSISDRKKKTSAIASALRDAKAERHGSGAAIAVRCLEGRKIETIWQAGRITLPT
jgi:hypothetical protein